MSTLRGDEARGGGTQHELEQFTALAAHLQTPTLLVHREHDAPLEAAAEVDDARRGTDTGQLSGGTEHASMLRRGTTSVRRGDGER